MRDADYQRGAHRKIFLIFQGLCAAAKINLQNLRLYCEFIFRKIVVSKKVTHFLTNEL